MSNLLCVIISLGVLVISVCLFIIAAVLERIADKTYGINLHRIEDILEKIADKIESEDRK